MEFCIDEEHTFQESKYIQAGNEIVTVELFGIKMGLSICYDLRFPKFYRQLVKSGAKVIFVPSAFTVKTGKAHWEILLRARAIENQCFMVAPAQFGRHNPQRSSFGQSMIVDPWGKILALALDKESVIVAELDFDYLDEVRSKMPIFLK